MLEQDRRPDNGPIVLLFELLKIVDMVCRVEQPNKRKRRLHFGEHILSMGVELNGLA